MRVININGPINSGKSTISKLLLERLPNSIFIECDELTTDEAFLSFTDRISARLHKLYTLLEQLITEAQLETIIFAYPMYLETFDKISTITVGRADFVIITLSPSLESCMTNRGTRELDEWEQHRIQEMYKEGVAEFEKTDLFIDNTEKTSGQTVEIVLEYLKKKK
ncbi:hypothetical protein [Lactococcus allomyrinae]|uniref:Shikimate kinase n=1 Tax=Lactococcus allomyrinae TaxID=2419773 RepID=A0A387BIW5_9LACT|nr:hypothetical protein [Lactococcus allomyrinae]AYG01289.1 hypothetical protein D7I46_09380 [Lactococcus allomyrinae]